MADSRGTELKVKDFKNYNVVFGAMNKNKPKSIYIKVSAWGNPKLENDINYRSVIRKINKRVRTLLYRTLNNDKFDVNKTMVDLDMRDSGITYGKSSYMSCEITLYQHNYHLLKSEIIQDELNSIVDEIIKESFNKDEHFKFYKKKSAAKIKLKMA